MFQSNILAIDLGSSYTRIFAPPKGIAYQGMSFAAKDFYEKHLADTDMQQLLRRLLPGLSIVRPIREGVIADFDTACAHLGNVLGALESVQKNRPLKAVMTVKKDITEMDREAFGELAKEMHVRELFLMDSILAAAMGAGVDIRSPKGSLIMDVGGGKTQAAVVAFSDTISYLSARVGGDTMDLAVSEKVLKEYEILIGAQTACTAKKCMDLQTMELKGRDTRLGIPASVRISGEFIREAVQPVLEQIAEMVRALLAQTPPELLGDVVKTGLYLTGGCAYLSHLVQMLQEKTGLQVRVPENPEQAVINGAGQTAQKIFAPSETQERKLLA